LGLDDERMNLTEGKKAWCLALFYCGCNQSNRSTELGAKITTA
jgi:hypothetical protein